MKKKRNGSVVMLPKSSILYWFHDKSADLNGYITYDFSDSCSLVKEILGIIPRLIFRIAMKKVFGIPLILFTAVTSILLDVAIYWFLAGGLKSGLIDLAQVMTPLYAIALLGFTILAFLKTRSEKEMIRRLIESLKNKTCFPIAFIED